MKKLYYQTICVWKKTNWFNIYRIDGFDNKILETQAKIQCFKNAPMTYSMHSLEFQRRIYVTINTENRQCRCIALTTINTTTIRTIIRNQYTTERILIWMRLDRSYRKKLQRANAKGHFLKNCPNKSSTVVKIVDVSSKFFVNDECQVTPISAYFLEITVKFKDLKKIRAVQN